MNSPARFTAAALCAFAALCTASTVTAAQTRAAAMTCARQGIVHKMKEGLRDTTDALHVTPSVKSAISGDSKLNNTRNHINVSTKDYVVSLEGHVYSSSLKARAGAVASRKLNKLHKGYRVSNMLKVTHG